MKVFRYILAAVLFAAACPLYAQWSCGVDAAAGIGYLGQRVEDLDQPLHRYSGQGALRLGYRSPRFTWSSSLGANYDFRETDTYRFALTGENLDQDIEKSFLSANQKELWVESARLNRRILLLGGSWNF